MPVVAFVLSFYFKTVHASQAPQSAESRRIRLAQNSGFRIFGFNNYHKYLRMIPAITPPTDNLYKFIALFGLTIFLFSAYNISLVYDSYSLDKTKIEELRTEVQKKIIQKNLSAPKKSWGKKTKDKRLLFNNLSTELHQAEAMIEKANLTHVDFIEFKGEVNKLNVAIEAMRFKMQIYLTLGFLGVVLTCFGFIRWKKKEQDLRDKILNIEHTIKQLEHENKAKKKKKKRKAAQLATAALTEKQHVPEHVDQN